MKNETLLTQIGLWLERQPHWSLAHKFLTIALVSIILLCSCSPSETGQTATLTPNYSATQEQQAFNDFFELFSTADPDLSVEDDNETEIARFWTQIAATPTRRIVVATPSPRPTTTATSEPSLTATLEPTPTFTTTQTPTITSTATPHKFPVTLSLAKEKCEDQDPPKNDWGMDTFEMTQIDNDPPTYTCLEIPVMQDGLLTLKLEINKPPEQDHLVSYGVLYVPFYFTPGAEYEVQILECDDICNVELLDAGNQLMGLSEAELGTLPQPLTVSIHGSTYGFIRVDMNDTQGGEGKVVVEIRQVR